IERFRGASDPSADQQQLLKDLNAALVRHPENAELLQIYADLLMRIGESRKAQPVLRKISGLSGLTPKRRKRTAKMALDLDAEDLEARENLARAYEELGDQREAGINFQSLAKKLWQKGDQVRAIEILRHSISIGMEQESSRRLLIQWLR